MYLQTLHGRPIVGGYISCTLPRVNELVEEYPYIATILEAERSPTYRDLPADPGLGNLVRGLGVSVVVIHRKRSREWLAKSRAAVEDPLEKRLFNPEKGIREVKIEEASREMKRLWGPPGHVDDAVEIYWKRTD